MQKTLSVINLPAIRRNAKKIKSLIGTAEFYAVVKADAYGHGAEEVSRYIEDVADGFCVAIVEEGIALRIAGVSKPVLVLTPPLDGYDVERAKSYNLLTTVNSVETARLADGAPCHIKVNTGMNRSGCNLNGLGAVLNSLKKDSVQGVYSHLFAAESKEAALRQRELFKRAVKTVKAFSPEAVAHLSASGGTLRGEEFLFDGVRCGLLLYGYAPAGFKVNGFERALKVYARRTQTTQFIGGGIGYNFADKSYKTLATYRCGYADGFLRNVSLGEKTLCMDAFVGVDKGELLCVMDDAEKYAQKSGTISYEVLTSVTRRSERIYER
ncbi:MAG: alanine racemase [Clostridia bacterium]|nr:alanine racemase [Clostridia bacterium]